ncbi:MAG: DUF2431 domain-containing protein [Nanoarchaeota archaeon]|nr:DUF2431 domain-containing protein [Nanoarchaeota archaeon]
MTVYEPQEDSYLMQEELIKYLNNIENKNIFILDMGSGSGIQAKTCKDKGFNNILAADINPESVKALKKQKIKVIESNLFSNIQSNQKFDLIVFNPPYLPEDKYDKNFDTTAGKYGYELIIKFLKQAKPRLNKNGEILLLFSSLSKPNIIKKQAIDLGYDFKLLNKKNLFFEELNVCQLARHTPNLHSPLDSPLKHSKPS